MFVRINTRRAKLWWSCVSVFVVAWSSITTSADLKSVEVVAAAHAKLLEKPGLHCIDGYCFSVGNYATSGTSDGDVAITEEGASLVAYAHFLATALLIDDAPDRVGPDIIEQVRKSAAQKVIDHLQVSGVEQIDDHVDAAGNVRVVLAVAQAAIDAERRHWGGCMDLVRQSAVGGDPDDARLWAQVLASTGGDSSPAIEAWQNILCSRPGVAATVRATPMGVTDGWVKLPEVIGAEKLSNLADDRLLDLIDRRPFDGNLIDVYRSRLVKAGHTEAGKATKAWHRVQRSKTPLPPAVLDATLGVSALEDPSEVSGIVIIFRYAESWPLFRDEAAAPEAVGLFKAGKPDQAISVLLKQFCERPNPDTASYVAACLLALAQPAAAEFWSRRCFDWAPTHPYAGVNLMRAIEQQNRLTEAKAIAAGLAIKPFLDAWGRAEVDRVLAAREAPARDAGQP
jgi:hypothetical protein